MAEDPAHIRPAFPELPQTQHHYRNGDHMMFGVWEETTRTSGAAFGSYLVGIWGLPEAITIGGRSRTGSAVLRDRTPLAYLDSRRNSSVTWSGEYLSYVDTMSAVTFIESTATVTANFGASRADGTVTVNLAAPSGYDDAVTLTGNLANVVDHNPGGFVGSQVAVACTGTCLYPSGSPGPARFTGYFFGPTANEVGGTFRFRVGNTRAVGGFGAR